MTNEQNKIIQTFDKWGSIFRVEFDITVLKNPPGVKKTNILHLTTDGNCCQKGQRVPNVEVKASGQVWIATALNGHGNRVVKHNIEFGKKYHFVIQQALENGIVMYKIIVDGVVIRSIQNTQPEDYYNVKAYLSDPWKQTFNGCLENLELVPGNGKFLNYK